jgi:site-specific recombinase XerD
MDFIEELFRVEEQLPPLKRGEVPYTVKTKSRRAARVMPFLPAVADALSRHLRAELEAGRGQADDFVFVTRTGRPYTRQNISERGIEAAGVRAGLGEDIRAQTLRHSFCTFVAESGISPNEAAALTGHTEAVWWKSYVQPRRDARLAATTSPSSPRTGSVYDRVDRGLTSRALPSWSTIPSNEKARVCGPFAQAL